MKKDNRKRRLGEEEPESLSPEQEQFMLSFMGGCFLIIASIFLFILLALFGSHA